MRKVFNFLFLPAIILVAWYFFSSFHVTSDFLLPSPKTVWNTFLEMLGSGELVTHIAASTGRVATGFLIAAFVAIPLAYYFYCFPSAERRNRLVLEALRFIPPLSLIPLLILWMGIGEAAKLSIVVLASFFPIYLNVQAGFKQVDENYTELSQLLKLNKWEKFINIEAPSSFPNIITGLRLGFGYSWRALVGAELIAASSGLGYLIGDASEMSRTDKVFVGIICIALLGLAIDQFFLFANKKMTPWKRK